MTSETFLGSPPESRVSVTSATTFTSSPEAKEPKAHVCTSQAYSMAGRVCTCFAEKKEILIEPRSEPFRMVLMGPPRCGMGPIANEDKAGHTEAWWPPKEAEIVITPAVTTMLTCPLCRQLRFGGYDCPCRNTTLFGAQSILSAPQSAVPLGFAHTLSSSQSAQPIGLTSGTPILDALRRKETETFFLPAEGETATDAKVQQDLEELGHLRKDTREEVIAQAIEKYRQRKYLKKKYGS